MSVSVKPFGSWAAAEVISLSVMRRMPVAPAGRKMGTQSCFCWSVRCVLLGVKDLMALPNTFCLALVMICLAFFSILCKGVGSCMPVVLGS